MEEKDNLKLEKVNDMFDKCFSGLFQNLDLILDGILPETEGEEELDEGPESEEFENKTSPYEDEIHQYFDEVRTIFNDLLIQKPSSVRTGAESQPSQRDEKCKMPTSTEKKVNRGKRIKCQYPNCNYRTTKAGLENGEAAKHILNHGLTSRDLKDRAPFFKTEARNAPRQK